MELIFYAETMGDTVMLGEEMLVVPGKMDDTIVLMVILLRKVVFMTQTCLDVPFVTKCYLFQPSLTTQSCIEWSC